MSAPATAPATVRRLPIARAAVLVTVPVLMLAAAAARTRIAADHPQAAALLLVWIVTDTLLLARVARRTRRPAPRRVVATLAAAAFLVWIGGGAAIRTAVLSMPVVAGAMAAAVAAHVALGAARGVRIARRGTRPLRSRLAAAAATVLPAPLVRFAAAELAVLHLALFRWGGAADVPPDARAFAYHRHLAPICTVLLSLGVIEAAAWHLLLGGISRTAMIALFAISDVGLVYLVGLIKSFRYRPVLLTPRGVRLRAGLLIDVTIPYGAIRAVRTEITGDAVRDPSALNAALLAWPNILLHLDPPLAPPGRPPRRHRPAARMVLFRLDDPAPFVHLLRQRIGEQDARR